MKKLLLFLLLVLLPTDSFAATVVLLQKSGNSQYLMYSDDFLGLGTTSPYAKLSVVGEVVASHYTATTTATSTFAGGINTGGLASSNGVSITGGGLRLNSESFSDLTGTGLDNTNGVLTPNCVAITGSVDLCDGNDGGGAGGGVSDEKWATTTSGAIIPNFATAIGTRATTTPFSLLSIAGTSTPAFSSLFLVSTSTLTATSTAFVIDNNGKVGIGTTSPGTMLSIGNSSLSSINFNPTLDSVIANGLSVNQGRILSETETGSTTIAQLYVGNVSFETDAGILDWVTLPVKIPASGTPQGYIANLGAYPALSILGFGTGSDVDKYQVAVGTTTPWAKLSVWGTTKGQSVPAFSVANIASTTIFQVRDNGETTFASTTSGLAVLSAGTVTVTVPNATKTIGNKTRWQTTTQNCATPEATGITATTSTTFTVGSSNGASTCSVAWLMYEEN